MRFLFLRIFLLIFLINFVNPFACLYAQEACKSNILGEIRSKNKEKIIGVSLILTENNQQNKQDNNQNTKNTLSVVSDDNGKYSFKSVCKGNYSLKIIMVGFLEKTLNINVLEDKNINNIVLNIVLEDLEETTETATVHAHQNNATATLTTQIISSQELEKLRGNSLGDALKGIAGVNTLTTGGNISKPMIQGMHSNRILILNNGIRQEGQNWGAEHAPEIDPFVANELSVIKGAASVRYGADAIGGVVLVTPPKLKTSSYLGANVDLVGNSNGRSGNFALMLEGSPNEKLAKFKKLKGLGWRVQMSAKQAGNLKTPTYYLINTGVKELNFSGALGYTKDKFSVEGFYSRFSSEIGIFAGSQSADNPQSLAEIIKSGLEGNPPPPIAGYENEFVYTIGKPNQKIIHHLAKINGCYDFEKIGNLTFQYGFQQNTRQEFDFRRGQFATKPVLSLELSTHTAEIVLEHKEFSNNLKNFKGNIGISGLLQDNINEIGIGKTSLIPNARNTSFGAFFTERYIKTKYELEAGIRYDYRLMEVFIATFANGLTKPRRSFSNISFAFGGVFKANNHLQFRTNIASAWRAPSLNELYSYGVHQSTATYEVGNDSLNTEKAFKWINTATYQIKKLTFEASFYANFINDYIYIKPISTGFEDPTRGVFPVFSYTQTNAQFFGTDITLKYEIMPSWALGGQASLIRGRDISQNTDIIFMPPNKYDANITFQPKKYNKNDKDDTNINHIFDNTFVTLSVSHVSKQRYAPPNIDFGDTPAAYQLVNLSFGTSFYLGKSINQNSEKNKRKNTLSVNFSVANLFNTTYRDYLNRFRYYANEIGRNYTIRMKYSF